MNYNIDEKKIKLFKRLAKKNATVLQRLRKLYHNDIKDDYICNGYLNESDAEKLAKSYSSKMSPNWLCNFYVDYYDADPCIFPKNAVKTFSEKEIETLDF